MYAADLPGLLLEGLLKAIAWLLWRVLIEVPGYAICEGLQLGCESRSLAAFALSLGFWLLLLMIIALFARWRSRAR
jgi:hypothetical protein